MYYIKIFENVKCFQAEFFWGIEFKFCKWIEFDLIQIKLSSITINLLLKELLSSAQILFSRFSAVYWGIELKSKIWTYVGGPKSSETSRISP